MYYGADKKRENPGGNHASGFAVYTVHEFRDVFEFVIKWPDWLKDRQFKYNGNWELLEDILK